MIQMNAKIVGIEIQNFRSIKFMNFEPDNYNVLFGNNGVGKSNVLRALNLFFNNQTDLDTDLDFEVDLIKWQKKLHRNKITIASW